MPRVMCGTSRSFFNDACPVPVSLQVERLSKSVVAKRAELQNLEAESSAKQARKMHICIYICIRIGVEVKRQHGPTNELLDGVAL